MAEGRFAYDAPQELALIETEAKRVIDDLLLTLTPRQERVIRLRFGLDGDELTRRQIADNFKLTYERVRATELEALKRLRHYSRYKRLMPYVAYLFDARTCMS